MNSSLSPMKQRELRAFLRLTPAQQRASIFTLELCLHAIRAGKAFREGKAEVYSSQHVRACLIAKTVSQTVLL